MMYIIDFVSFSYLFGGLDYKSTTCFILSHQVFFQTNIFEYSYLQLIYTEVEEFL